MHRLLNLAGHLRGWMTLASRQVSAGWRRRRTRLALAETDARLLRDIGAPADLIERAQALARLRAAPCELRAPSAHW